MVGDRQMAPVGQQGVPVGPEDPPDVRGVVHGRVVVDVVPDLERQTQRDIGQRHQADAVAVGGVGEQPGRPGPDLRPHRRTRRHQRVERGCVEQRRPFGAQTGGGGAQVQDVVADADADARGAVRGREDGVREVVDVVRAAGRGLGPGDGVGGHAWGPSVTGGRVESGGGAEQAERGQVFQRFEHAARPVRDERLRAAAASAAGSAATARASASGSRSARAARTPDRGAPARARAVARSTLR